MFELFRAWREIAHIAEWTGLSVGVLAGLAAIVYLDPALRKVAIRIALAVIAAYALTLYVAHRVGSDVRAEWAAADAKNRAEADQRDKDAPRIADADTELKRLRAQIKADEEQLNALRKPDAACHPIAADELR